MAVQNSAAYPGRYGSHDYKHQNEPCDPAHGERLLGRILDRAEVRYTAEAERSLTINS